MKNNKGFFLAETIVMIALVTTIMAFVYPNVSKLYENYKNRVMYYDQTEDLYALRAYYELNKTTINDKTEVGENDCKKLVCSDNLDELMPEELKKYEIEISSPAMNIEKLYIMNYMSNPSSNNYNFNRYLKRLKKSTNDTSSYRLIGVFNVDGKKRYASIKIDNPNIGITCKN